MLKKDQIEALKQKHGNELKKFTICGEVFVVRPPTVPEYRRCMDRSADDNLRTRACEELGDSCTVYPDDKESAFAKLPGAAFTLGNKALEMVGLVKVEEEKL